MPNEQRAPAETLEEALEQIALLDRRLQRAKQENQVLASLNDKAERLRRYNESEHKLQYLYNDLLLANCPNMLFLFDDDMRFALCSEACAPLLAAEDRRDLVGQPFEAVFAKGMGSAFVGKVYGQCVQAAAEGAEYRYDDTVNLSGDTAATVQVAVSPIIDDVGRRRGALLSINDITELALARDAAEEAARSKSRFLANMSHEIRTPMNAVKGFSELLSLTELDEVQRNYLDNIQASSASLISIINDVLDFSSIDTGRMGLLESPYKVDELLAEVCNVVGLRAEEKGLLLLVEADPALPAQLWGDAVRIKQILVNLLDNAVKYTVQGFIRLVAKARPAGEDIQLCFSVQDSGIGIREGELDALFDAFSRAGGQVGPTVPGAGLGLPISKQLAEFMGGEITAESTFGGGSIFEVCLPQQVVDARPMAAIAAGAAPGVLLLGEGLQMDSLAGMLESLHVPHTHKKQSGKLLPPTEYTHGIYSADYPQKDLRGHKKRWPLCRFAALRSMHGALQAAGLSDAILFTPLLVSDLARFLNMGTPAIPAGEESADVSACAAPSGLLVKDTLLLVVDDNEVNLLVASEMLRSFGAEVQCADGGEEALKLCARQPYDIIFLDHMMPGMDGTEVTVHLRSREGPNRQTPIVALTANVADDMQSYYVRNGMDDLVAKPATLAEMSRVLQRWLPETKDIKWQQCTT